MRRAHAGVSGIAVVAGLLLAGGEARADAKQECAAAYERTQSLRNAGKLIEARKLPGRVAAPGLRCECAVIVNLAERLTELLRQGDPLATRVKLTKRDFAAALARGLWRGVWARRAA